MRTFIWIVISIALVSLFIASVMADDETFELTDTQAKRVEHDLEEMRKDIKEKDKE